MESVQSKIYKFLLKAIDSKSAIKKEFSNGKFNSRDCPEPPAGMQLEYAIEKIQVKGRNVFTIKPKSNNTKIAILYLHGGAYVHNMAKQHWKFLGNLIRNTGCSITVPDYPLAPMHTYKDSFEMLMPLYKDLIQNTEAKNLVLMGDSAGGGFALSLAQELSKTGNIQPAQIILLSPWLDASLTNPDIKALDQKDPFLGVEGLQLAARSYSGDTELTNPLISPIYGSFENPGEISLFTGSHDILFADAKRFKAIADIKGLKINYFEYPNMIHVWMLLNMPEAKKAMRQIVQLLERSK